jgi:putative addiction module component (TIGR02574 family)
MKTIDLINEVISLPVEDRALVADAVLSSLNQPAPEIDAAWLAVAKRRAAELRSGKVDAVPGEIVFQRIQARYSR